MQIKNMFEKQIDRDIKGVIKVGQSDEENVYQELDEYVVTKELLKHFRDFFNNYEKGVDGYTDKMGVWISGFFGSGKSHFLKILSYLLKNSTVEGKRAIEYFTDGKKIEDPHNHKNLVSLCPNCHRLAHENKIEKSKLLEKSLFFLFEDWKFFYNTKTKNIEP